MDRRGFLKLFATASVGVPVAQHVGLFAELTSWVLGPQKTIFVPPAVELFGGIPIVYDKFAPPNTLYGIPYYETMWQVGSQSGISRSQPRRPVILA